ncbi:transposase [Ancylobacter sonchi]|nr:transposase [Ancylobacter sonchi]
MLADRADDATSLCGWLTGRGTEPAMPTDPTRKNPHAHDRDPYRARNPIGWVFCRLKDFRRIATRDDKRADIFLSAVCIAASSTWWTNSISPPGTRQAAWFRASSARLRTRCIPSHVADGAWRMNRPPIGVNHRPKHRPEHRPLHQVPAV